MGESYRIRFNDELYHYGIKGMKWGVRNGPPYPIEEHVVKKEFHLSEKHKKAIKIGASIIATSLVVSGGVALSTYCKPKYIRIGQKLATSTLPTNLQFFAAKPKKPKPIRFKDSKEYAIVMNAFRTTLTRDEEKLDIVCRNVNIDDRGAYFYTAINHKNRIDFTVIGKKKISDSATGLLERYFDND